MGEVKTKNELKRCPFCNGDAYLELSITNVKIECGDCNAKIIKVITSRIPDIDFFKESIIEAWNKRV